MDCPQCNKFNDKTNRFCVYCGELLINLSYKESDDSTDLTPIDLKILYENLNSVTTALSEMNKRLSVLEVNKNEQQTSSRYDKTLDSVVPSGIDKSSVDVNNLQVRTNQMNKPFWHKLLRNDWESILGGNWLALIGVIALIFGVGFFLKLAFDNNWIDPTSRVIVGIIIGVVFLGAGHYWRKRYPFYSHVITGGGIAVLYLAFFAGFILYHLINIYIATSLLFLVSTMSAALAIYRQSMALAIIGIIGAFSAPFILIGFDSQDSSIINSNVKIEFLIYIIAVDIGVLVLSTFRNWQWFTLLAFVCSFIGFEVWRREFGSEVSLVVLYGGLTIMFLTFVGATTFFHLVWRRIPRDFDRVLMVLNAAVYYSLSLSILWEQFRNWMGGFSLLLALLYGGIAYVGLKRSKDNAVLSFFALAVALVFLTIAIPIQLGDIAWTTISWAVEGAVLIFISFYVGIPKLRVFGYLAFGVMTIRLVFFDAFVDLSDFTPIINERFSAFIISIGLIYLAALVINKKYKSLMKWEQLKFSTKRILFVLAHLLTLWLLTAEILAYFDWLINNLDQAGTVGINDQNLENVKNLSVTALWTIYAISLLVGGIVIKSQATRIGGLVLLIIPIVKVFAYDVFILETVYRAIVFIGLGVLLLIGGYLYQRYRSVIREFILAK